MAALSFSKHPNQVSFSWSDENRSRSKAQMSLKKIIDFITSSCSSSSPSALINEGLESRVVKYEKEEAVSCGEKQEIVIDLKLRLGSKKTLEENQSTGLSAACSGVGEVDGVTVKFCSSVVVENVSMVVNKSSEGECDVANSSDGSPSPPANQPETEVVEAESEITNLNVQSSMIETEQICEEESHHAEKPKKDGYLSLLVEAAKLVSGGFEDDEKPKKRTRGKRGFRDEANEKIVTETETERNDSIRCGKKTDDRWISEFYNDFEDVSPVVRSKRGRNQVLPSKYRDSVLEPWKNISRPRSSRSRVSSSKPKD